MDGHLSAQLVCLYAVPLAIERAAPAVAQPLPIFDSLVGLLTREIEARRGPPGQLRRRNGGSRVRCASWSAGAEGCWSSWERAQCVFRQRRGCFTSTAGTGIELGVRAVWQMGRGYEQPTLLCRSVVFAFARVATEALGSLCRPAGWWVLGLILPPDMLLSGAFWVFFPRRHAVLSFVPARVRLAVGFRVRRRITRQPLLPWNNLAPVKSGKR